MKSWLCVGFFLCTTAIPQAQNSLWISFGPMVHWNFSTKNSNLTYAIEGSLWRMQGGPNPIKGWDFGFETDRRFVRLYSEFELSKGLYGLAIGPVLNIHNNGTLNLGIQGSVWADALIGADLRFRLSPDEMAICPGLFFKLALPLDSNSSKLFANSPS